MVRYGDFFSVPVLVSSAMRGAAAANDAARWEVRAGRKAEVVSGADGAKEETNAVGEAIWWCLLQRLLMSSEESVVLRVCEKRWKNVFVGLRERGTAVWIRMLVVAEGCGWVYIGSRTVGSGRLWRLVGYTRNECEKGKIPQAVAAGGQGHIAENRSVQDKPQSAADVGVGDALAWWQLIGTVELG